MAVSWLGRGPMLAGTAIAVVAAAFLLVSGQADAGLPGYDDRLDALEVHGFPCVPATSDASREPRADIQWVMAAQATSNHLSPDGIVAYQANGDGNLYKDPLAATGDPAGSPDWFSLGPGGYLMAQMQSAVHDEPGVDLIVAENVGLADPFCLYGSLGPDGPWTFIGWWHGFENQETVAFDLNTHFVWHSETGRLDHVLIVDAALQAHTHVDFVVVRGPSSPPNATGAAVQFRDQTLVRPVGVVSYHWTFGDGATSRVQHPVHRYAEPGVYEACLEVRLDGDAATEIHCQQVPVENRPPSPAARGIWQDASHARFVDTSTDADGEIMRRTWTLPDGSAASGLDTGIVNLPEGLAGSVCIEVEDDLEAVADRCYALEDLAGSAPTSGLADTVAVTGGQPLGLDLQVHDADGHTFRCVLLEGPEDAVIGPDCTLEWLPSGEGRTCLRLRFEDITSLASERRLCLQTSSSQGDEDSDGVADAADNCPGTTNRDQADEDRDGIGDACQDQGPRQENLSKDDGATETAGCPPGPDRDHDGLADGCDRDIDGDGVPQAGRLFADNCPYTPNADQVDVDRDGIGDACQEAVAVVAEDRACTGRCGAVVLADACRDCAPREETLAMRQGVWLGVAFAATVLLLATVVAFMTRNPNRGP